jgi:hypothetical protein
VGGVGKQRLRHINDSVLSLLKMEGLRLFLSLLVLWSYCNPSMCNLTLCIVIIVILSVGLEREVFFYIGLL